MGRVVDPISDWPEQRLDAGAPLEPASAGDPGMRPGQLPIDGFHDPLLGGAGGFIGGAPPHSEPGAGGASARDAGVPLPSFDAGAVLRDAGAVSLEDAAADAAADAAPGDGATRE